MHLLLSIKTHKLVYYVVTQTFSSSSISMCMQARWPYVMLELRLIMSSKEGSNDILMMQDEEGLEHKAQ